MAAPTDKEQSALVTQILNETKPGRDEHAQRKLKYDRSYKVYRPSPDTMPVSKDRPAWMSRIRIPYAMSMIDTALVNISQSKPRCRVLPRLPMYRDSARKFQLAFDYFTEKDHLQEKDALVVQQALIYGVTVGKNHWLFREGQKIQKAYDPAGVATVTSQTVVLDDRPCFEPWDVYCAWWDPNGRDVDSCAYFVLESWLGKQDLLRDACTVQGDHTPYECDGVYHNVDRLLQTGGRTRETTSAQDQLLGTPENARRGLYQVWEIWRDSRCTIVGNQQVLLRDGPNPHWHGRKPIVAASMRPDLFKVAGIPETELIDHLQQAVWTATNLTFENMLFTVHRGWTYREGGVVDPDAIDLKPRALVPVTDHDDLRPLEMQPLPPEAFRVKEELLGDAQQVTGISPYVAGADMSGVDQNTATGVSILNSAASRLLQFKAGQVRTKIWQRTFEQWGDLIQQYMDKEVAVRVEGPDGEVGFDYVTPQEVVGDYDYRLVGTDDSVSRQQDRTEVMALLNALAPFIQAGVVNVKPLLEHVARVFDYDNPEELFQQPAPPPSAAPLPSANGAPSAGPPGAVQQPALNPQIQQLLYPRQG